MDTKIKRKFTQKLKLVTTSGAVPYRNTHLTNHINSEINQKHIGPLKKSVRFCFIPAKPFHFEKLYINDNF